MINEKKIYNYIKSQINKYGKPFKGTAYEFGLKIMNYIENMEKVGDWISCSERLPKNEEEVEITYTRKNYKTGKTMYFTARAFYEDGTMNTEDSDYCWYDKDNWEYVEEKDSYIIPEGWFEVVSFSEEFGAVDMPVIAWQPLPEPYKEG